MASDLSRNNSAEDPTLRHQVAHNDGKKNDRAEDPDHELEYEKKKESLRSGTNTKQDAN
jgi:hypothetical protein